MVINGKVYDWGSVDVKLPGLSLEVQEISYDDEQDKEVAYGRGYSPRGIGKGNYKASSKISLLRDDFNDLLDYCKKNNLALYELEIPKILVSYANDGDRTRTDVLNKVTISKTSHKNGQGDKSLKVDLDMILCGQIERDGVKAIKG